MKHRRRSVRMVVMFSAILALGVALEGCAARGARNKTRVAALTVGDAAVAISQTEATLFSGGAYPKATHDQLNPKIITVLKASRAFERAAAGWQGGDVTPASVETARTALLAALDDLQGISNDLPPAFRQSIDALRSALAAVKVGELRLEAVSRAETPGLPILALIELVGALVTSGRSTYEKIKAALKSEGATDEELAAVDAALTREIDAREAEQPASDSSGSQG